MNAAAIIRRAAEDGVSLALTTAGTVEVSGDSAALAHWLPTLREHRLDIIAALQATNDADPAPCSRCWRLTFGDGSTIEIFCAPPLTRREALRWHRATAADTPIEVAPFEPTRRPPAAPMTDDEAAAIRAWLAHIGETDQAAVADVLNECHADADTLAYFKAQTGDQE